MTLTGSACRQPVSHSPVVPAAAETGLHDTASVLAQLEYLGNIAYDHPDQFIHNPDSFINLLPALPVTTEGQEMYAWLLLNIGYGLREAGDLLGSTNYYERAMDYCTDHGLTNPDFVLYVAKPLGNLYTQIGDLQKALHIHELAITDARQRNDTTVLPALYTNMATVYQQIGRPDSLLHICKKGLQYTRGIGPSAALLYNLLAGAYQQLSVPDSARHFNQRALVQFAGSLPTGDTLIWYTNALHQQAILAVEQNQLNRALLYLNRAIALTEQAFSNSKQRDRAKYYHARGSLFYKLQRDTEALRDFRRVLRLFTPEGAGYFPDYTYTEALLGLARTHAVSGDPDSARYYYTLTIENAYYTQQLIVSEESHYQNSAWNRNLLNEAADLLWDTFTTTQNPTRQQSIADTLCWLTELSKGRQLLQEINRTAVWGSESDPQQRKRKQLQFRYQAIAQTTDPEEKRRLTQEAEQAAFEFQLAETHFDQSFTPPNAQTFIRQLVAGSDSTTLVSYFTTPAGDAYVTAYQNRRASMHRIPADTLANISQFIHRYFSEGPTAYDNDPVRYEQQAGQLAAQLLPFGNIQGQICISPDGPLFRLPFDALIHNAQFLGKEHILYYTYTFLLQSGSYSTSTPNHPSVRIFAKSRYDEASGLSDLPAITDEATYLANLFRTTPYWDDEATDRTFFQALESGDLIHLAAHAVADHSTDPYIAFSQPITLSKLRYIRAVSPLIFLSACQTASGELLPGEGVESLNKAFLSKGVKGVIASYWSVDDQTTATLTRLFYEALTETGHPASALALAKQRYLSSAHSAARNPWFWASLQFTGADTYIAVKPAPVNFLPWLGMVLILVIAAGLTGGFIWHRSGHLTHPFQHK